MDKESDNQEIKPQCEVVEVHNAYYFHYSDPESGGLLGFSRPQDWGNKELWAYERFKFEWVRDTQRFINHAHCWYNPKEIPQGDVPIAFSRGIAMIMIPGKPEQLCGNQYLEPEDFWCDEWGEIPPVYFPDEILEYPPDELD